MGHRCTLMSSCCAMWRLVRGPRSERLPPSFHTLLFVDFATPDLEAHLPSIPRTAKKKHTHTHHPAQPRSERANEMRACPDAPTRSAWRAPHRPHAAPEDGPVHTRNESVFVHVRTEKDVSISTKVECWDG